jgi:hypothetical protein
MSALRFVCRQIGRFLDWSGLVADDPTTEGWRKE